MAVFGLTYNMMDRTGIDYPILSTNWASASWASYYYVARDTGIVEPSDEAGDGKDTTP